MSNSVTEPGQAQQHAEGAPDSALSKGKGRSIDDSTMDDDEDDDEEDYEEHEGEVEEPDEDNMEEIDTENIVGSRTRGKNIDFAQAAKDLEGEEEDDEDDDEDFEMEDEEMAE